MCSIIGCNWKDNVAPILVKGLKRMEYRGYDSVGISTIDNNQIKTKKGLGKVEEVNQQKSLHLMPGQIGIGHTRWATHGKVSLKNCHPHLDTLIKKISIVHNGIIENYQEIKKEINCTTVSETDSEIIVNLLAYHYKQTNDIKTSAINCLSKLKGCFAFVAVFEDGTLLLAKSHEPLIIGISKFGHIVSSDVLGFIEHTNKTIYLDNYEFAIITPKNKLKIFSFTGESKKHVITELSKEISDVYKHDYAHFTLKEIHEQPEIVLNKNHGVKEACDIIKKKKNIYITGSGTSYHAALIGKFLFDKYADLKVETIISSETKFIKNIFDKNSVLIAISQSGESADVLETVDLARKNLTKIISISNSHLSTLSSMSDANVDLNCGPEIGVAATKSFISQLKILIKIIQKNNLIFSEEILSENIKKILTCEENIKNLTKKLKKISSIYILGRGIHYPIALEASLKLKELAYIHAEGIPGGEIKHGPLALIKNKTNVIIFNPQDATYNDTIISVKQLKSRGANIIGISNKHDEVYDTWIEMPNVDEIYYPILEIIPMQLLAYYLAIEKNNNPDYPRNIAKSVTVK